MSEEKQSLLALSKEYQAIENQLMEAGGELSSDHETWMQEVCNKLLTKVDAYVFVLEKLEADADFFKAQAQRFQLAARARANMAQTMKDRVKFVMREMDAKELPGDFNSFKLSSGRKKLVMDESKIPPEFFMETIVRKPNMELIETALQNGIEVEGCRFEDIYSLRVGPKRKS